MPFRVMFDVVLNWASNHSFFCGSLQVPEPVVSNGRTHDDGRSARRRLVSLDAIGQRAKVELSRNRWGVR